MDRDEYAKEIDYMEEEEKEDKRIKLSFVDDDKINYLLLNISYIAFIQIYLHIYDFNIEGYILEVLQMKKYLKWQFAHWTSENFSLIDEWWSSPSLIY